MADDPSLDDFLDADPAGSDGDDPGGNDEADGPEEADTVNDGKASSTEGEPAEEPVDGDPAEKTVNGDSDPADLADPAVATYDWSPAGAPCADCGADIERRWLDDGDYVCADCKEW